MSFRWMLRPNKPPTPVSDLAEQFLWESVLNSWTPLPCVNSHVSAIERFRAFANQLQPGCSYEDYHAIAEPLGELVEDPTVVAAHVLDSLVRIKADETYYSTQWGEHSVILATDLHWQLRVGLYTGSSEHIYSFPFHFAGVVVGKRSLEIARYRLPPDYDGEVFVPGAVAMFAGRRTYGPGEVFTFDSRREAFDVHVAAPVVVIKFITTPFVELQWAFDRQTLKATQAISSSPLHSELVTVCLALKAMKRTGSEALLDRLSRHPAHFVRWAAIQGLGAVSPNRALERLRQSLKDEHPHIRSAAAKHLARSR